MCRLTTWIGVLIGAIVSMACSATPTHDPALPSGVVGENCPARALGERLGVNRLMVGGSLDDESFAAAPFDLRYVYVVGPAPSSPCASCAHGCEAGGASCANNAGGCPWWGCWQYDGLPPGQYVADFIEATTSAGAVPMFTYYVWLSVAGTAEGTDEIAALSDPSLVARYLADWRFFCETVADTTAEPVIAHIEPDLWGFAQQVSSVPSEIPVAVHAAVAPECADLPDTMAGFSRCMLAIARSSAPNLLVGFHASAWAAGHDVYRSTDENLDVAVHADETAAYLVALGASDADLIVVEMSDRDAGAGGSAWDATNETVPNFDRAVIWVARLSTVLDLAPLWWQVPFGHQGLDDTCDRYTDNRVDYFFDHPDQFAAGGAIGIAFGAGAECMTSANTDDGHFLERADAFFTDRRPCLCGVCR